MSKYDEALQLYISRQYNRKELCERFNLLLNSFTTIISKKGIEIWDWHKMKSDEIDRIILLYKQRKLSREQIAEQFNMNIKTLNRHLILRGIDLWDKKSLRHTRMRPKRNNKYFDWSDLKGHFYLTYNR